jgi:hypothetical protein
MTALAEAAHQYAAQGWPIFPLSPRSKVPLIPRDQGGRGCHDASMDADQIRRWWRTCPTANIALGCGEGCWVLDVDGEEGLDALAELEDRHRWLPVGPASVTGSGGMHLFFAPSPRVRNSCRRIGGGLDTRAAGGAAVLPPSVHPNGCRYAWLEGREPWSVALPEAPPWLLDLLDPPRPAAKPWVARTPSAAPSRYLERAIAAELEAIATARPGTRNATLFKLAASLGRFGADRRLDARAIGSVLVDAALAAGLPRHEAEQTAASGLRAAIGSAA